MSDCAFDFELIAKHIASHNGAGNAMNWHDSKWNSRIKFFCYVENELKWTENLLAEEKATTANLMEMVEENEEFRCISINSIQ